MERKWLKDLRKEKGLTLKELGQRVGHSESYLFHLENGTRKGKGLTVELICRIATATGALAYDLLQAEQAWLKEARG